MTRTLWICAALLGAAFALSLAVWPHLPPTVPIHWNAQGVADGYASRTFALLFSPILGTVITGLLGAVLSSHPGARPAAPRLCLVIAAFFLGLHALVVGAALSPGHVLSVGLIWALLGGLFAALGLAMPLLRPNPWAGVRLPWTLSDEVVWRVTHRFAAWAYVITGLTVAGLGALLPTSTTSFLVCFVVLMVGALSPVPYSLVIHRLRRT